VSEISYRITQSDRGENVVAFFPDRDEPIVSATSGHENWDAIKRGLFDGDDSVYELFDTRKTLQTKFKSLSERVSFNGDDILFDGDPVHDALAQQVKRFVQDGVDDYQPLVNFWEKIAQNPSSHSRDNLYRWLQAEGFSITLDGDIVAYKGVRPRFDDEGEAVGFESINSGPAVVDDKPVNGYVPNDVGSVITMPRSQVTADPRVGCHVGLHVGTWSYANGFSREAVLEVHVNPRDVVSVPTDCSSRKMRVSRYVVVQQLGENYTDAVIDPTEDYTTEEQWRGDVGYKPIDF
jgi:hypothetical protein